MEKNNNLYLCSGLSIRYKQNVYETRRSYYCLMIIQKQMIGLFCVSSIRDTHRYTLSTYIISMSELYIMPPPGWHDYRPAFNSLNRPRFPIAEPSHIPVDWGKFSRGRVFSKDANRGSETV